MLLSLCEEAKISDEMFEQVKSLLGVTLNDLKSFPADTSLCKCQKEAGGLTAGGLGGDKEQIFVCKSFFVPHPIALPIIPQWAF